MISDHDKLSCRSFPQDKMNAYR